MSTELQEYYTYCYDTVEDPNQPNYEYLKDIIKVRSAFINVNCSAFSRLQKSLPANFDFNTPMPWELKPSDTGNTSIMTQETYPTNEPNHVVQ